MSRSARKPIGDNKIGVPPQFEMLFGFGRVAQALDTRFANGEWNAGGTRIEGQRLLEHRDRALVVAPRERGLAKTRHHRDVAGRQLRRALE
jgi:hypothetical protein